MTEGFCSIFSNCRLFCSLQIDQQWEIDKEVDYVSMSDTVSTKLCGSDKAKTSLHTVGIKKSAIPHGILYWYKLVYMGDIEVDTFSSTFYNSACFLLNIKDVIPQDAKANVTVHQAGPLLKIQCSFQK